MDEDNKINARNRNRHYYFRKSRNTYLKCNYGITIDEYDKMLEIQGNCCAVCGNLDACNKRSKYNMFSVDHDHKTGKVRGLLCAPCNFLVVPCIEYYSGSRIQAAQQYLQKFVSSRT